MLKSLFKQKNKILIPVLLLLSGLSMSSAIYFSLNSRQLISNLQSSLTTKHSLEKAVTLLEAELEALKNDDQYKRNEQLKTEVEAINKTYQDSLLAYEKILDLQAEKIKTDKYSEPFAQILKLLADRKYSSAEGMLVKLNKDLDTEKTNLAQIVVPPVSAQNITVDNKPPTGGYKRQKVETPDGTFTVDIVAADLNTTRVIVDTASESDCGNDCPVLPLSEYVARNGAFAGINGSFFCPTAYPSCAGKTNSFDTLLMNKNKKYFNSDNNIYSVIPAVVFAGNSARFISRSLEWGRDTGVDAVIANYPLLVLGGNPHFTGSGDPKLTSQGPRTFIGATGSTVYMGVISGATSINAVQVLKALGIQDALGLDQGGSTALWFGGWKAGPGRNIPNAILFVKK